MTQFVFENFVNTTLADAALSTATTLTLSSATGLPSTLAQGQQIPLVLNSASNGSVFEVCYITAINGATVTVLRAQEGTSAQNWNVGDFAYVAMTAGTAAPVIATHSPTASETLPVANQLVVTPGTLTAAIDLTLNDTAAAGSGVTIYGSAADYAVTVQSPVTTGSPYIELPDGSQVYSWAIPAASPSQGIRVDWDGTNWRAWTFGQTVVAPATQSNAAVQLGQVFIGNRKAVFTANGTWTVPDFVSTIWVSGCAAGAGGGSGGGGGYTNYNGSGGGGGGVGQSTIKQAISVTGGHTLSIAIGAGGAGGSATTSTGYSGAGGGNTVLTDSTSSTTLLTLTGGSGGGAGVTAESVNPAGAPGGSGYPSGGYGSDGCGTANNMTGTALGGVGASSPFGGGGCPGRAGAEGGQNGSSAYGYGGGGGGGGGYYGGGSGSYDGGAGGNGAPGFLVIEW